MRRVLRRICQYYFWGWFGWKELFLFKGKSVKAGEGGLYYRHKLYKMIVEVKECEQELREGSYVCRD